MPDCRVTAISENSIVTKDPITTAHPSEELNVSRNDFRHNVVQKIRAICALLMFRLLSFIAGMKQFPSLFVTY